VNQILGTSCHSIVQSSSTVDDLLEACWDADNGSEFLLEILDCHVPWNPHDGRLSLHSFDCHDDLAAFRETASMVRTARIRAIVTSTSSANSTHACWAASTTSVDSDMLEYANLI